jgi:hypothetical protein
VHAPNQSWLLIFLISSFGVARLRSSPDHSRLEVRMRRTSKSNSPGADLRLTRIIYGGNLIDVEAHRNIAHSHEAIGNEPVAPVSSRDALSDREDRR